MNNVRRALFATAISTLGVMSAIAGSEVLKPIDQPTTRVKTDELNPFTHLASIPEGSDLSSIKFERVKLVKVATHRKSVFDERYCEEAENRDSSGSIRCPQTEFVSSSPAYEVTYSYHGQPLASDEYGSNYFTFSVYLRPDELSAKSANANSFVLTAHKANVQASVVDEAASTFCAGNFVDGSWRRADRNCSDKINTKSITATARYITVRIDPAPPVSASNSSK